MATTKLPRRRDKADFAAALVCAQNELSIRAIRVAAIGRIREDLAVEQQAVEQSNEKAPAPPIARSQAALERVRRARAGSPSHRTALWSEAGPRPPSRADSS